MRTGRQLGLILSAALLSAASLGAQGAATGQPDAGVAAATAETRLEQVLHDAAAGIASGLDGRTGSWLAEPYFGIEFWRYLFLLAMLLATFIGAWLLRLSLLRYGMRLARKTRWVLDDLVFEHAVQPASLFVTTLGIYIAILGLIAGQAPAALGVYVGRIALAVAAGAILWYLYRLVDVADHYLRQLAARSDNDLDDSVADVVRKALRVFILVVGALFIGNNVLAWNLTALLASAGVLGLAVAFAAQDTIANFFGTLMLLLDKPFRLGERVILGDAEGPVEAIGFRSTRIRTLDGHQVSIPNKDVANSAIVNVGRRPHIKRVSNLGVTYDTPVAKVERAVEIVRNILHNHKGMDPEFPPRVYFTEFNDYSLNILMVAWFSPPDYWEYLEWCHDTNLEIMRQFEAEGIEFAFPTTTTYLAHDPNRPLTITTKPDGSVES